MKRQLLALAAFMCIGGGQISAKDYTVASPNGQNVVTVNDGLTIRVSHADQKIVSVNAGLLSQRDGSSVTSLISQKNRPSVISEHIVAPFYRQKEFTVAYSQLDLKLSGGFGLQVRAYDEGVAYRFYTTNKRETIITDETADFCFLEDSKAWLAYSTNDEKPFAMAFQNYYDETLLSEAKDKYAFLPATIESGGVKVTILESDLRAYPGMFLVKKDSSSFTLHSSLFLVPLHADYVPDQEIRYFHDQAVRTAVRGNFLHLPVCADDAISLALCR